LYLCSSNFGHYSSLGPRGESDIRRAVYVDAANGSYIVSTLANPFEFIQCEGQQLQSLRFSLRDGNGQLVDMRGRSIAFSIIFLQKYMEIISEPIDLEVADAPDSETPAPEPEAKRRAHRAAPKAAPKARVRQPALESVAESVAEVVVEPAPVEPSTPAPKARVRKPAARATTAPTAPTAPGISDVLGMLATALLDQRQARSSQRQAMYSRFLD
jgi:pyruvate/2-oxoglutarate dehydrogenase complex dihydrolipoamide acyltransferase (E2) component